MVSGQAALAALGGFEYNRNDVVLHTDERVMPRRRKAWASWNYFLDDAGQDGATVTYWMNRLQSIDADRPLLVTLNRGDAIDPRAGKRFADEYELGAPLDRSIPAHAAHLMIGVVPGLGHPRRHCPLRRLPVARRCRLAERLVRTLLVVVGAEYVEAHLLLVDVTPLGVTGKEAEHLLDQIGVTVNKNAIPFDQNPPMTASGIRIGTPAVTTRGLREAEMDEIAALITRVLEAPDAVDVAQRAGEGVRDICRRFPLYPLRPQTVYVNFGFWDVVHSDEARPPGFLNRRIERKVAERTADLVAANEQMGREVVERQRAEHVLREAQDGLGEAVDDMCKQASQAIKEGYKFLILSDRGVNEEWAPIPSLIGISAIHHHLVRDM